MMSAKVPMCWLAAVVMMLATGCASAYRDYPGCHVNGQYCAPRPLPYELYDPRPGFGR
jgi:hypothetical protein